MTFIPSVLSEVDNGNSYTTNLTSNTSFTGTSKQTTGYATIDLTITSDQSSASSGIQIQFSDDGSSFTTYNTDTYFSGTIYTQTFKILKKYYRIVYTNGSVETSNFNLISRLNVNNESGNSQTDNYGNTNTGYLDAFGKMRVTNPFTLLDLQFNGVTGITGTYEINNNILMMCTGTTGAFKNISEDGYMILTGTGAGYQINQSRKYCNYQPGKSLLFMASGVIYESGPVGVNDYTARIGYFDAKNGLFFQYSSSGSGTMSVNVRNQTIDTSITQTNWNIDKMDGSGPSGYTLNFNKSQLFVIDFEWLGVGRIRYGFYVFGQIYYCHQITNVNILTAPYISISNLPIRYEIRGTNPSQTTPVIMKQICGTVISEGGYNPIGYPFSAGSSAEGPSLTSSPGTEYVVLALRGNNNYYHENIVPIDFQILDTAQSPPVIIYRLRLFQAPTQPNVSSPLSYSSVSNSSVIEVAVPNSSITLNNVSQSINIVQGFSQGKGSISLSDLTSIFSQFTQITSNIDNISDVLVLTVQIIKNSSNILASINWTEAY
jgi:hypothetical protein